MATLPGTVIVDEEANVNVNIEEPGLALYQVEIKIGLMMSQELKTLYVVALSVSDACACVEVVHKRTVTKVSVFQGIDMVASAAVRLVHDLPKKA